MADPVSTPSVLRRSAAIADGFTDHDLRVGLRRGDLTRIRRGYYADPGQFDLLDELERHRLAAVSAAGGQRLCVLSHASAAAFWRMPLHRVDLSAVHFTRVGARSGRRTPARIDHAGALPDQDVRTVDGVAVTSVARTLVDLARSESAAAAVVAADHALRRRMTTPEELLAVLDRVSGLPGVRAGRRALSLADGRAESPGESLTRLALRNVRALDAQVTLTDEVGGFVARTDFAVRSALLVIEFDGRQKYVSRRRPGQSVEDAVVTEKHREDAIRSLGYLVLRLVWRDLDDPERLRQRVDRALDRGQQLVARGVTATGSYTPAPTLSLTTHPDRS